jgi:diguanylate cyclase (GGDEF)-like protein/PAS domain S-box-containing protein
MIAERIEPQLHPDDEAEHKEKLRFLRDTPHSHIFSCHRSRHKNGQWIWLETHGYNMMHDDSIDGLVFSLEDITLRKNAESQLHEETALLRAVLDHNPAMIYAKDTQGHFTISNLSFQKLFGYSNEEDLRGKTAYELLSNSVNIESQEIASSAAKRIESQDRYIMDTGEPLFNLQGKGFFHHDLDRWYYTNKYPLRDAQGHMIGVLGITQDTTDRRDYESRIEYQAMHDSLTGLPNRRLLVKHLANAMHESRQQQSSLTLLFCDLDFFKSVNDTHGHDFGDKCLIETSKRILTALSSQDFVARFGGNEFVILTSASLAQATVKADTVMQAVSQPLIFNDVIVKLEASIGIAQLSADHRTPAELIQDADAAMYQAKERGRNRIEFYDAGLQSKSSRQARMDVALRFALERNELSLTYQPKVSLADGSVMGFEVLLRWNSPEYGLISPNEFIPIAERSGLVVPIGMWTLEHACRQLAQWHARYPSHATMSVAVNVSMRQLMHAPFLTEVRRILDETDILPQTLELELTETSAMANPLQTIENLTMLKKLGLSLALDDFGTGYSSLAYLQKLPLDVLKIDQTFVRGLGTNDSDMEIMRLIMVLAQTLKLRTVAEGVETPQHIAELKKMGCDMGQGFVFSTPLSAEEAEKLIRTSHRFLSD